MTRKLLVIERHHLGDAVMALPFLRAARKRFDISVAVRSEFVAFWNWALPGTTVLGASSWLVSAKKLPRLGREDVAVCVWADPRAHLLQRVSGAGTRLGFSLRPENFYGVERASRKRQLAAGQLLELFARLGGPLLTHPLRRKTPSQLSAWQSLAEKLGFASDDAIPWVPVNRPPALIANFISDQKSCGRPVWILHPGGRLPTKRWPLERFQALVDSFFPQAGVSVVIIAAPGEPAPKPQPGTQRSVSPKDFDELAAILAAGDGVLANDSFAAHLAAAVGKPVVTIFGSGDPAWFAPFQNSSRVVKTDVCHFRPCVDRCLHPSPICLESISNHLVEKFLRTAIFPPGANPVPPSSDL